MYFIRPADLYRKSYSFGIEEIAIWFHLINFFYCMSCICSIIADVVAELYALNIHPIKWYVLYTKHIYHYVWIYGNILTSSPFFRPCHSLVFIPTCAFALNVSMTALGNFICIWIFFFLFWSIYIWIFNTNIFWLLK